MLIGLLGSTKLPPACLDCRIGLRAPGSLVCARARAHPVLARRFGHCVDHGCRSTRRMGRRNLRKGYSVSSPWGGSLRRRPRRAACLHKPSCFPERGACALHLCLFSADSARAAVAELVAGWAIEGIFLDSSGGRIFCSAVGRMAVRGSAGALVVDLVTTGGRLLPGTSYRRRYPQRQRLFLLYRWCWRRPFRGGSGDGGSGFT